mmetsp:Transcript_10275/g.13490  ORF Transcript_10275/g.13490 Transcript_10275/m.13490 type:complete len:625 (+) Transcript_10275:79-1953(+)
MGALFSRTTIAALAVGGLVYGWLNRDKIKTALIVIIANKLAGNAIKKLTAKGEKCEITTLTVDGETYSVYKNAPSSLPELYLDGKKHVNEEFLMFTGKPGHPQSRFTFGQAAEKASLLGEVMKSKFGLSHGDNVAILLPNMNEAAISIMAVTALGGVSVMLNGWWSGEEIDEYLDDCKAKILIVDEKRLGRIEKGMLQQHIRRGLNILLVHKLDEESNYVKLLPSNVYSFESVLLDVDEATVEKIKSDPFKYISELAEQPIVPEDSAMILYTSGTSSRAKGVILSHLAITQSIESYNLFLQVIIAIKGPPKRQRCDLITGPMFHTSGLLGFFLAFRGGHKLVFFPRWRVDDLIDTMIEENVTYFAGVPTMVSDMINNSKFKKNKDKFLFDNLGTGGAKIDSSFLKKIQQLFPGASQGTGWGMTETAALGTVIGGPQYLALPSTCGKPHAIVQVKLINPDTLEEVTAPNTPGELCLRTPTIMKGYLNAPELTAQSFIPGTKWYRTGDVGKQDENGFYYIVDRIKDIVIRGGENIACSEVESVVLKLSSVIECAAFGLPDERLGEKLCIAVTPSGFITEKEIQDHISLHLAKFKVPSKVFIRKDPLPRNAVGKIVKNEVKSEYKES